MHFLLSFGREGEKEKVHAVYKVYWSQVNRDCFFSFWMINMKINTMNAWLSEVVNVPMNEWDVSRFVTSVRRRKIVLYLFNPCLLLKLLMLLTSLKETLSKFCHQFSLSIRGPLLDIGLLSLSNKNRLFDTVSNLHQIIYSCC